MEKISLKSLNLKEVEQLSREQLKNVLGGWAGGTGPSESETSTTGGMCDQESECSTATDCGYLGQYTCDTLTITCDGVDYSWTKCKAVVHEA